MGQSAAVEQLCPQLLALSQKPMELEPAKMSQKQEERQPPVPWELNGGPVQGV
jgi:hypothetical protein